jgi:rhodanese-related sulfurtransferase
VGVNLKIAEQIAQLVTDKSMPVVESCSIGYRSAEVASGLLGMGYGNVLAFSTQSFNGETKTTL